MIGCLIHQRHLFLLFFENFMCGAICHLVMFPDKRQLSYFDKGAA
jgi:hypothetical protein